MVVLLVVENPPAYWLLVPSCQRVRVFELRQAADLTAAVVYCFGAGALAAPDLVGKEIGLVEAQSGAFGRA